MSRVIICSETYGDSVLAITDCSNKELQKICEQVIKNNIDGIGKNYQTVCSELFPSAYLIEVTDEQHDILMALQDVNTYNVASCEDICISVVISECEDEDDEDEESEENEGEKMEKSCHNCDNAIDFTGCDEFTCSIHGLRRATDYDCDDWVDNGKCNLPPWTDDDSTNCKSNILPWSDDDPVKNSDEQTKIDCQDSELYFDYNGEEYRYYNLNDFVDEYESEPSCFKNHLPNEDKCFNVQLRGIKLNITSLRALYELLKQERPIVFEIGDEISLSTESENKRMIYYVINHTPDTLLLLCPEEKAITKYDSSYFKTLFKNKTGKRNREVRTIFLEGIRKENENE